MLGFLFGFNARLGRMHYFLAAIALAVVMTAICFAIAGYAFQHSPSGPISSAALLKWPVIAAMPACNGGHNHRQNLRLMRRQSFRANRLADDRPSSFGK